MSGTSSTVSSIVNNGAISTIPPTLAAAMIASTKPIAERSSLRWKSSRIALLRRYRIAAIERNIALADERPRRRPHRHPDVVAADDGADQEQQAPGGPCDVIGIHRDQAVDERVGEGSFVGVGPPHQTLQDPGVPHREDVNERPGQ